MKGLKRKWLGWLGLTLIVLLLIVEIAMRLMGTIDFPIYHKDSAIGYVPAKNQQGSFLNKNDWVLNEHSLGTKSSWPEDAQNKLNIMLVGDSVVWGGNPLNHPDKMGAQLEQTLGENYRVWSASAGGWSAENEVEMVNRNNGLYQHANTVIWILNSGDLAPLATSSDEDSIIHPSSKPWSAVYYYTQKYLLPKLGVKIGSENPAIDTNAGIDQKVLTKLQDKIDERTHQSKSVIIVEYPDINEVRRLNKDSYQKLTTALQPLCNQKFVKCVDLIQDTQWNDQLYRDGIHPSIKGNSVIAKIIAKHI